MVDGHSVVICGAGITGCTLALFLVKKGYTVEIIDKRSNLENAYASKKRTVGMSISERGIHTLRKLGIYEKYHSVLVPKYGRAVHLVEGDTLFQEYGRNMEAIYTINRKDFNWFLMDECLSTGKVHFYFDRKLEAVDFEGKKALFISEKDKTYYMVRYKFLFGCDGCFSPLRNIMDKKHLIKASHRKLEFLYKEIYIPPKNNEYVLNPNFVHIWNVRELLFVALPDGKNGFNCTMFYTNKSEFARVQDLDQLNQFLKGLCDFLGCIQEKDFISQFHENPVSAIYEVDCSAWNYKNEVLLMGDAAHAMPPFYAMGMNTCLESVRVFADWIDTLDGNLSKAIETFTHKRKPDTDAMKYMARVNYDKLKNCHKYDFDANWQKEQESMKTDAEYETEYYQVAFTNKNLTEVVATSLNKIKNARPAA